MLCEVQGKKESGGEMNPLLEQYGIVIGQTTIQKLSDGVPVWSGRIVAIDGDTLTVWLDWMGHQNKVLWSLASTVEQIDAGNYVVTN